MKKKFVPPSEEQLGLFAGAEALADPGQRLPEDYGVRRDDPATARQALDPATLGRQGTLRRLLVEALRPLPEGLTYEEAAEAAGISFQSCPWKRLQELTNLGWTEVCGVRSGGQTGKAQQVYRLTRAARAALGETARPTGPTEGLWKS